MAEQDEFLATEQAFHDTRLRVIAKLESLCNMADLETIECNTNEMAEEDLHGDYTAEIPSEDELGPFDELDIPSEGEQPTDDDRGTYDQTKVDIDIREASNQSQEIYALQMDLESSVANLMNAAMDFSRSELIQAKRMIEEGAAFTDLSPSEIIRDHRAQVEKLEKRMDDMRNEISALNGQKSAIENLLDGVHFEQERIHDFDTQKGLLITEIDVMKAEIERLENMAKTMAKVDEFTHKERARLLQIESAIKDIRIEAESVKKISDDNKRKHDRWVSEKKILSTKLEALHDEIYISGRTKQKEGDAKSELVSIIRDCDRELRDLGFFKHEKSETIAESSSILKSIKEISVEIKNVKTQIDTYIDERMRNAVM
jgi:TolA-binding protein